MNAFLGVIKKELASVLRDRTILIAVLIQLFIASFSSALLLGLLSLYDADTIMQVGGSGVTIGMVGGTSAAPLESLLRARGLKTVDYVSLPAAQAAFYQNKVIAIFFRSPLGRRRPRDQALPARQLRSGRLARPHGCPGTAQAI